MVRVKICGLTNLDDAQAAMDLGADALGFIFAPGSPRAISVNQAQAIISRLPALVQTVGVFVDADWSMINRTRRECGLDVVQLHGREDEDLLAALGGRIIKVVRVGSGFEVNPKVYPDCTLLLDTYSPRAAGGTGETFDWNLAVKAARYRPIILAGGLRPENVAEAVALVNPYGVDVCSGVEKTPGRKDYERLQSFIRRAKGCS